MEGWMAAIQAKCATDDLAAIQVKRATDDLAAIQAKMEEYRANGARRGWLLDLPTGRVFVYRPESGVVEVANPTVLAAAPELSGFVLDLAPIWSPSR